jgi:RNA polymerase sigma-70 factor (ECF subfamily)
MAAGPAQVSSRMSGALTVSRQMGTLYPSRHSPGRPVGLAPRFGSPAADERRVTTGDRDFGFSATDVAAAKIADSAALGRIWRALQPALLRYLRSLGPDDAEDVPSVVWTQLAAVLETLSDDSPESLRKLLFTIARRRRIDEVRRRVRREPPFELDTAEYAATPEGRLADAMDLLQALPPAQAEVVALRVVVGFSAAEVGELTGRSAGAVRVMAHRGLARLRELLEEPLSQTPQSSDLEVTRRPAGSMDPVT